MWKFLGFPSKEESKPEPLYSKPWREVYNPNFTETAYYLEGQLKQHRDTRLNIVLIGPTGAGKSTLINSIFSVSRGQITDQALVKSIHIPGVGSSHFLEFKAESKDLFRNIHFYDTMGFVARSKFDDAGIKEADLKAVFEGRISTGHEFNTDSVGTDPVNDNKPHCVIYVVSAEQMDNLCDGEGTTMSIKLESLHRIVPHDVARIAVITKIDCICNDTNRNIECIYSSKKVHDLVRKAEKTLGVQENKIFPIVNFVKEMEVSAKKSVPILYALRFALNFALDRNK